MRRDSLAVGGLVLTALAGCVGPGIFVCQRDDQCGEGRCEATGSCSFPDPQCGWRYSDYSPPSLRGRCVATVSAPDAGALADGPPQVDAVVRPPDAIPPSADCLEACPGTCVGDTCILDCGPATCDGTSPVACPPGLACEVNCTSDGSCAAGVDCSQATSCVVRCDGDDSCANVSCNFAGSCTVDCAGDGSCSQVFCGSGRCDVTCGGLGSCQIITCPSACACTTRCPWDCMPLCPGGCVEQSGECTALPSGCDAC